MLAQIVRPLVETQIRLLANSQATEKTLASTISCWLGYLGVRTEVSKLAPDSDRISVSLTVGKPEFCNQKDWQKILANLLDSEVDQLNCSKAESAELEMANLIQLSRLLAYLIQVGSPDSHLDWSILEGQLAPLNLNPPTLAAIRSALKVPQSANLIEKLDPDLAARAFPLAVKIAWMDDQITPQESEALKALLNAIAPDLKV